MSRLGHRLVWWVLLGVCQAKGKIQDIWLLFKERIEDRNSGGGKFFSKSFLGERGLNL